MTSLRNSVKNNIIYGEEDENSDSDSDVLVENSEDEESSPQRESQTANGQGNGDDLYWDKNEYDPNQDRKEKQFIRQSYRQYIKTAENARSDIFNTTAEELKKHIKNGDELFSRIKTPAEAVLDSRNLLVVADTVTMMTKNLKVNSAGVDIDEFVGRIATRLRGGSGFDTGRNLSDTRRSRRRIILADDDDGSEQDEIDDANQSADIDIKNWDEIGKLAARATYRVASMDFMCGPIFSEPKEKVIRQRQARIQKDYGEGERLQELQKDDVKKDEFDTPKLVNQLSELLLSIEDGMNLFKFAINPHSFGQTVENFFYISFLVHNGTVSIENEGDDAPIIFRCDPPSERDRQEGVGKRQIVFHLDYETWEYAKKAYNITESVIPHRPDPEPRTQGKWYG